MVKPCKITDEIIKICSDNIRLGMSYKACSQAIGITYQTWNNWSTWGQEGKLPYAKWFIAIQAAEADLMKECLQKLRTSADLGNIESVKFILERRFSSEWGKQNNLSAKVQMESVNVNINPDLEHQDLEKIRQNILARLTPRQLPEVFRK